MADVHDLFLDLFTFIWLFFAVFIVRSYICKYQSQTDRRASTMWYKAMACRKRHILITASGDFSKISCIFPEIWGSDFQFDEFQYLFKLG